MAAVEACQVVLIVEEYEKGLIRLQRQANGRRETRNAWIIGPISRENRKEAVYYIAFA